MDVRTVMLLLSVGSFLFGLLLIIFKFNKNTPPKVPFWVAAKILQAAGSLTLYFRTSFYDNLTMAENTVLILGCKIFAGADCKTQDSCSIIGRDYTCMLAYDIFKQPPSDRSVLFSPKRILLFACRIPVWQIEQEIFPSTVIGLLLFRGRTGVFNRLHYMPVFARACRRPGGKPHIGRYTDC